MDKIPVIEVVRFSYLFLYHEFRTIVRLTWFPLAVASALNLVAGYGLIEAQVSARDFSTLPPLGHLWPMLSNVVLAFAYTMVAVALHRVILFDDRKPGTFLLFSLKRAEWLFIGYSAIVGLGAVVLALIGLGAGLTVMPPGIAVVVMAGLALAGTYLFLRFWMIYPLIVVEERLDLRRAFGLSRGNFWRLVGVNLLGAGPLAVVSGVGFAILRHLLIGDLRAVARNNPDDPFRAVGDALQTYLISAEIGGFVVSVVATGIGIPLICYSFKARLDISPFEYFDEHGAASRGGTHV